jgi:transcriptional regulator with XRE-family HTH domain
MSLHWNAADAENLKAFRSETGWDVTRLARFTAISVAQLTQLEGGGTSLFYSPTIKAQVGLKLLNFLQTHIPTQATEIQRSV